MTRNDVDILIRTDVATMPSVKHWLSSNKKNLNPNIQIKLHTSTLDMHNFRFQINDTFNNYDKILYLDTDILIANHNINNLFDEPLLHNIVYVVPESNLFNRHEWAFKQYTENEIQTMTNHNVFPFNNGQFMFRYNPSIKNHFDNVIKLSHSKPYNQFIDQQSMNHYFNTLLISDGTVLSHYTKLFATDTYIPQFKECILHFSGNIHEGDWKLNVMKRFLALQP
jgi:lipopolysaccharide biosynthesis glycosyltransferase